MEKKDIKISDLERIFIGEAPLEFLAEVAFRTLLIYIVLIVIARLLGKRMSGQLTLTETAVMITLGAIISAPMQDPQRGILQGIFVLLIALLFHWGFNMLGVKSGKFEKLSQGHSSLLVRDGYILMDELNKTQIARQELFAQLRHKKIYNLGAVKRIYLEGCGLINVFLDSNPKPGLPILPATEKQVAEILDLIGQKSCMNCGYTTPTPLQLCPNCKENKWTNAVGTK